MRRLITTGFICIIATMCICTFLTIRAIENIADTLDKDESRQTITYEEPGEEIVPVYYDDEEYNYNGNMIYTFGDISDKFYFNILINEEQGLYVYCFRDMRIEYESLAELQESVMCHIDQECPNATFVMRNN